MEKAIINEKRIEGIIGILFLLPAIVGSFCFFANLITEGNACSLICLKGIWTELYNGGAGGCSSSTTPIFFGLMAIAGTFMIKNSLRYFFTRKESQKK